MTYEKLEINLLTLNGKVERRIRAFAGRVTVLRGATDADLVSYTRALNGQPSADRFSIMVDSTAYRPAEHVLVGFGERFSADGSSVAKALIERGYNNDGLAAVLLENGLGGSEDRRCSELNEIEARKLRLLLACAPATGAGASRVVVLNDPFRDLDPTWIESLAERLAEFAWKMRAIVLVINLSNRPEAWIDNELIARIQVGGNRRRTIGFGSASPEMGALLEQLRNENPTVVNSTPIIESKPSHSVINAPNLLVGPPSVGLRAKSGAILRQAVTVSTTTSEMQSKMVFGIAASGFVIAVAVLLFSDLGFDTTEPQIIAVNMPSVVESQPSAVVEPVNQAPVANLDSPPAIVRGSVEPQSVVVANRVKPGSVLSAYPEKVVLAVMRAYDETDVGAGGELTALRTDGSVTKLVARQSSNRSSPEHAAAHVAPASIFGELRDGEESPARSSATSPTESYDGDQELQRRREMIRQRFLEAIERSAGNN